METICYSDPVYYSNPVSFRPKAELQCWKQFLGEADLEMRVLIQQLVVVVKMIT